MDEKKLFNFLFTLDIAEIQARTHQVHNRPIIGLRAGPKSPTTLNLSI